ncbi:MAG: porin family protein [Acidobacteria bacterium]|nr:porin family protein [Acidobacteriota bacterium]
MKRTCIGALAIVLVAALPAPAQAQTFLTPFAGATFAKDAPASKLTVGAALSFLGDVAGLELEVGYTPDFFDESGDVALVAGSNVTTAMASVLIAPRIADGRVRPYGVVGGGLLRTRLDDNDLFDRVTTNDSGVNVGFGVMALFSEHAGVRGDFRYFRSLQDPPGTNVDLALGKFDFWRATVGALLRF